MWRNCRKGSSKLQRRFQWQVRVFKKQDDGWLKVDDDIALVRIN